MIGFKLPPGARTIRGHAMDLTARPFGGDGATPWPNPHAEPEAWRSFRAKHARRYGLPISPDDPSLASFPGLEHPQYQSWLEIIAERNPSWFEQQGLGRATGTTASTEEIFDAQAWEGRARIEEEGRRLFMLDRLPDLPGTPSDPATPAEPDGSFYESMDAKLWAAAFVRRAKTDPGFATDEGNMIAWFANAIMRGFDTARERYEGQPVAVSPALPPLSPLSVRVEELRASWREDKEIRDLSPRWIQLSLNPVLWIAIKPFAIEGLHLLRLLRRNLGDTRALPGRE